jgi:hypothetical protein
MTVKTTTSGYLLLFRATNWTEDLSPEENKIAKFTSWFERMKIQDYSKVATHWNMTAKLSRAGTP